MDTVDTFSSLLAAPAALRCEYLKNPLGIDIAAPRFSWQLNSACRGSRQNAYQVLVAGSLDQLLSETGDKWDSGKVVASQTNQVTYDGLPLASRERGYWAVRCWDERGHPTPFSEPASFELALLEAEDWLGEWIGADPAISAPLFRRELQIDKPVIRARAYVCGLGYYELRLNGHKVEDHVLDPNWTNFDRREMRDLLYPFDDQTAKRVLYVTYDVTERLRQGGNAVGVMLGNGWYNQRVRTIEGKLWYDTPRLLLQFEILYGDGSCEIIVTDASWKCAAGPITENGIFLGETYDARRELPGWDKPGFDDSAWAAAHVVRAPTGVLRAQLSPPDKVRLTLPAKTRNQPKPGVFVFDFGQVVTGWVRLRVSGPGGTDVTLRFAEELHADGMLDFASVGGPDQVQRDIYILKGGAEEIWEPRFTWHGFRYVEVTGFPGEPPLTAVQGRVVNSDVAEAGAFSCSNPLISDINRLYRWTQLANYHGCVPSDCPHRERLGYTGDGQLTVEAAMLNFEVPRLYTKWLDDIGDAQNHVTGFVPHTAPFYGGGGGPAWGAACVILPWHLHQYYGDRAVLKRHYAGMRQWVEYLGTRTDASGIVVREEPGSWCLGDWSLPSEMALPGKTDLYPELVNTAYYAICARLLSRIAAVLEKPTDAALFADIADAAARALHTRFFDAANGWYAGGTKGADAFAWAAGAIPPGELPRVVDHVLAGIARRDGHFDTGIFGTPLLLDMLTASGHVDLAYRLMTVTTFPSFGHMLASGATTLWENWNKAEGSHCHPMYGSVSAWFYRVLAGIEVDPAAPGFEHVTIRPHPVGDLTAVDASVATIRGRLAVEWTLKAGTFVLNAIIPIGSRASIHLPTRNPAAATVSEGDAQLWRGAPLPRLPEGVSAVSAGAHAVVIETGGGTYRFSLTQTDPSANP